MYFVFLFVNISIGTLCLFVHPKGYSKSSGERGNYLIRTYLSFTQHKSSKIVCSPEVNNLFYYLKVDLTLRSPLKTPNWSL